MNRHSGSPAKYRFEDRVLFLIVPLSVLDGILGFWGFHYHHLHPAGALAVLCASVQSSPIIAFIIILGLYLAEEKDEFQKAVWVQSMLWATGATLSVTTFWGSMEKYSQVRHLDISWVQFLFCVAMIAAIGANRWRYR